MTLVRLGLIGLISIWILESPGHGFEAIEASRIDEVVRAEMSRQLVPGAAVAVIQNGRLIRAAGYGLANLEHQVRVTEQTLFQSGSLGKAFTAATVMILVEEKRIVLSDPLTKFFPEAPDEWQDITIHHLLTHTSGIPDFTDDTLDLRRDYSEEDLVLLAFELELEFDPGARWEYSNTGYVLLGIIIREASGRFHGDVLRERVFSPLNMKTARIISEEDIVPHRAAGYRLLNGELKNQEWVAPTWNTTADGSLYLSLPDLLAWDKGLRERRLLKAESWERIFTPVRLNSGRSYPYGYGWELDEVGGQRVERHSGSWQGFQTHLARYRGDDLTIAVLTNLAQAEPERFAARIAELFNPALGPQERKR